MSSTGLGGPFMSRKNIESQRKLQVIQIVAALYSLIFVVAIAHGYLVLLQKENPALAYGVAVVFALTAWNLARFVGSEENGIRKYAPLFGLLLLISAMGVFNTMLAIFESRNILTEVVEDTEDRFSKLKMATQRVQEELGITAKSSAVDDQLLRLKQEINNPMNCGQGPRAMEAVQKLKELLPGFEPQSKGAGRSCLKRAELSKDYEIKVKLMKANASWNKKDLQEIITAADEAQKTLKVTKVQAANGAGAIVSVSRTLEELSPVYQKNVFALARYRNPTGIPSKLDLRQVQSIGEWSQILNLVIARIGKPTTYFYLMIAGLADWMMVYLFSLIREKRNLAPNASANGLPAINQAW